MATGLAKNVFLALLFTFIPTAYAARCAEPRVRREWRSISEAEREEWVAAVKVRSSDPKQHTRSLLLIPLQCLKKVPHKPALTRTLDLAVSQIPPVNPNSSYFDGTWNPLLWKPFADRSSLDFVYVHMDLNPLVGAPDAIARLCERDAYRWAHSDSFVT